MEDRQIVDLYWKRSEQAIEETEVKYSAYCSKIAGNILTDSEDVKECLNDTWLHAWNTIPPQKPVHLSLFLAKIVRNLAFDRYRAMQTKRRKHCRADDAMKELEQCVSAHDTEGECLENELQAALNRFLRTLPERDCSVFLRRYFFMETPAEIAQKYGMKKSYVLVILSRTRKKLKIHLHKEEITDEEGRLI